MPTGQVKQKYAICTPDGNFLSFAKKGEARGRLRSRAAKPSTHQADPAGGNQEWTARISNESTETDDSAERKDNSGKPGNEEEACARRSAICIPSDLLFRSPSSARSSNPVSRRALPCQPTRLRSLSRKSSASKRPGRRSLRSRLMITRSPAFLTPVASTCC